MKSIIVRLFVPADGSGAPATLHGLVEETGNAGGAKVFGSGTELLGFLDEVLAPAQPDGVTPPT